MRGHCEQAADFSRAVYEWRDENACRRVGIFASSGGSVGEPGIFRRRNFERSEESVPDCEHAAKIAIVMTRIVGVMDLMMRRAQDDAAPSAPKRDPELRMLEMANCPKK